MIDQWADSGVSFSQLLALRGFTDRSIRSRLVVSSVVSWFLWALWLVEAQYGTLSSLARVSPSLVSSILALVALTATVPVGHLVFTVVNRRNEHFGRSEALLRVAVQKLKDSPSTDPNRIYAVNSSERDLVGLPIEEKERSGYLLSLLTLVPLLGWFFLGYALYRVDRDFQKHEQREFTIIEEVDRALGLPVSPLPVQTRHWYPHRNSLGYLALSVFTLGIFSIIWLYLAVDDPAAHFKEQAQLESQVERALSPS